MLKSVQEAAREIQAGRILAIAGEASLLAQLPAGTWIGGSIPNTTCATCTIISARSSGTD